MHLSDDGLCGMEETHPLGRDGSAVWSHQAPGATREHRQGRTLEGGVDPLWAVDRFFVPHVPMTGIPDDINWNGEIDVSVHRWPLFTSERRHVVAKESRRTQRRVSDEGFLLRELQLQVAPEPIP